MNIYKHNRGAISVFLVIILVPCMLASSLFVDLGRVSLSESMAKSSSDLALTSLLTKYDNDLKEFYGLAASCQSIEEFYDVSIDYFETTMAAQGLEADDIVLLSDYFAMSLDEAMKDTEGISNLLETEVIEAKVEAVADANMANATMIKDGIIEFMKYRAPIEIIGRTFLQGLADSENIEALKEAEADKALTEAKESYYDAEKNFNQTAKAIYDKIEIYNKNDIDEETVKAWITQLNSYEQIYKEAHSAFVHDISNTAGLSARNRTTYSSSNYGVNTYYSNLEEEDDKPESYGDEVEDTSTPTDNDDYNFATESDLKNLLNSAAEAINQYNTAKASLESVFLAYSKGAGDTNTYDIQYWAQSSSAVREKLSNLNSKAENLIRKYKAVENAFAFMYVMDMASYEAESSKWTLSDGRYTSYDGFNQNLSTKAHHAKIKAQYEHIYNTYISVATKNEGSSDKLIKYMSILERISNDEANKKKILMASNILPATNKSIEESIVNIYNGLDTLRKNLVVYREKLSSISSELVTLNEKRIAYESTYDVWKAEAGKSQSELGKSDREELYGANGTDQNPEAGSIDDTMGEVTEAQINNMKTRVNNIIKVYDYLINVIDNMKYGGKCVKDISNAATALSVSGIDKSKIKLTNGELKSYAESSFSFSKYNNAKAAVTINDDNNPNLKHSPIPELYTWMITKNWGVAPVVEKKCKSCGKKFDSNEYGNISEAETEFKTENSSGELPVEVDKDLCPECMYEGDGGGLEGDSENADDYNTDNVKSTAKNITGLSGSFPSGFASEGVTLLDNLTSIADLGSKLVNDFGLAGESVRDALYTTEYVFGMFSHAAFEKEAKYKLVLESLSELSLTESQFYGLSVSEMEKKYNEQVITTKWTDDAPTITYNKSLTNKMINAENNYAYGGEIEYILKSGDNTEALKDVYWNIYATRFITNSVAGFMTFWKTPSADASGEIQVKYELYRAISKAVSSATMGIIPEPLVKTVLILIEVGIETALDMEYLKAGMPVKFIKEKEDKNWGFSREIETEMNAKKGKLEPKGLYIQYSDYLYVFMLSGLLKTDCLEGIYERIGDVIQANMREVTKEDSYSLSKSITHFKFSATLRVSPLMVTLPIFNNYETGMDSATDWCTYGITTIRGY